MSKSLHAVWITICLAIFTYVISVVAMRDGRLSENQRLYNKCLAKNPEMLYNKAIEHCKEEVK